MKKEKRKRRPGETETKEKRMFNLTLVCQTWDDSTLYNNNNDYRAL
jgi:hypothetical protein